MTKRYPTLQKKLQKLEAQLAVILSFPPHIAVPAALSDDFEQRQTFLRHFLAAEIASRPSKPRHLAHISRRLDQLGDHFAAWRGGRSSDASAPESAAVDDDGGSACSCTESCLNDDGEAGSEADEEGLAIVEYDAQTASLRDGDVEFSDCLDAGEEERLAGTRIGLFRGGDRRVLVFGIVGLVGFVVVVFVIMLFGYGIHDQRFHKVLTPT